LNDRKEPQDVRFFIKTKCFFQGNWGTFYFFQEVLVLKGTGETSGAVLSLPRDRPADPENPPPNPQKSAKKPIHTKKQPGSGAAFEVLNLGILSETGNNYYSILRIRQAD
jgi:hypothetical protein